MSATWEEFERLDLAVGRVVGVDEFPEACKPAWKLTIDRPRPAADREVEDGSAVA